MSRPASVTRRVRIDRLELDLRGIAPATANAAARALGPALADALASTPPHVTASARIDAGRITSAASPSPTDVAAGIARRIAHTLRREGA
jgi:hypothetical protein